MDKSPSRSISHQNKSKYSTHPHQELEKEKLPATKKIPKPKIQQKIFLVKCTSTNISAINLGSKLIQMGLGAQRSDFRPRESPPELRVGLVSELKPGTKAPSEAPNVSLPEGGSGLAAYDYFIEFTNPADSELFKTLLKSNLLDDLVASSLEMTPEGLLDSSLTAINQLSSPQENYLRNSGRSIREPKIQKIQPEGDPNPGESQGPKPKKTILNKIRNQFYKFDQLRLLDMSRLQDLTVYISNIPSSMRPFELYQQLKTLFGETIYIRIIKAHGKGRYCYGFAVFELEDAALQALTVKKISYKGKSMTIKTAKKTQINKKIIKCLNRITREFGMRWGADQGQGEGIEQGVWSGSGPPQGAREPGAGKKRTFIDQGDQGDGRGEGGILVQGSGFEGQGGGYEGQGGPFGEIVGPYTELDFRYYGDNSARDFNKIYQKEAQEQRRGHRQGPRPESSLNSVIRRGVEPMVNIGAGQPPKNLVRKRGPNFQVSERRESGKRLIEQNQHVEIQPDEESTEQRGPFQALQPHQAAKNSQPSSWSNQNEGSYLRPGPSKQRSYRARNLDQRQHQAAAGPQDPLQTQAIHPGEVMQNYYDAPNRTNFRRKSSYYTISSGAEKGPYPTTARLEPNQSQRLPQRESGLLAPYYPISQQFFENRLNTSNNKNNKNNKNQNHPPGRDNKQRPAPSRPQIPERGLPIDFSELFSEGRNSKERRIIFYKYILDRERRERRVILIDNQAQRYTESTKSVDYSRRRARSSNNSHEPSIVQIDSKNEILITEQMLSSVSSNHANPQNLKFKNNKRTDRLKRRRKRRID